MRKKLLITTLLLTLTGFAASQNTSSLQNDLQTLYSRKVDFIIQDNIVNLGQVPQWMSNFSAVNGTWSDVDYTSGCPARRANWPAQQHFNRIVTLATEYYLNKNSNNSSLLSTISKALDYWFDNNYTPDACLDQGGLDACPCGTPGFWNTNWFGQMILMPRVISNTCLLLKGNLTATQLSNCTLVSQRVYNRINTTILGIGPMTGANMLDSATIVLNLGLLTDNAAVASDALNYFYNQTLISPETGADGIKVDGSYLQHLSQLYTGNYGKDFINSVVNVYSQTANTSFSPPLNSQSAFETLINGTEWMIVSNYSSNLLWEYSAIGRMVSFKAADKQASGGVALNLTRIQQSTSSWASQSKISTAANNLRELNVTTTEGQGKLEGTRHFYAADYLVHRSASYVTTLKSFSTRTSNSECNNDQNPFGFHLSDGSIFTYIDGDEYLDVFAAWDWNLVPGTTVDYGATPFSCNRTQFYGNTSFVGAVTPSAHGGFSTQGGMAVMQYLNPMTGSLRWEKTFYFFPGFYAVQIGPISSSSSQGSAPIVTTLDQSNLKGDVYVNGELYQGANNNTKNINKTQTGQQTVWHNKVLYTILDPNITLKVDTSSHAVNNWTTIGISQGFATQRIFTATLNHPSSELTVDNTTSPLSYVAQLGVDSKSKTDIDSLIQLVHQDDPMLGKVRGAYHVKDQTIALAFWSAGSYSNTSWGISLTTDAPILTFLTKNGAKGYQLTVSDPTQLLTTVNINVTRQGSSTQQLQIALPAKPYAGSSVSFAIH